MPGRRSAYLGGKSPGENQAVAWESAPWYNKPEQFFGLSRSAWENPDPDPDLPGNPAQGPTEPEQIFGFPTPIIFLPRLLRPENGVGGRFSALPKPLDYSAAS